MSGRLQGKTAVIAGADGEFGAAVAKHLASLGCSVAVVGETAHQLVEKLQKSCDSGTLVVPFSCTFQKEQETMSTFSHVSDKMGPIHVLVNCMGTLCYGDLFETTPLVLEGVLNSHVVKMVTATKAATPFLETTQGVVINISSSSAQRTSPGLLAFSMANAGVNYFTQYAALELAKKRIRVNAVSPSINVFESCLDNPILPYQETRKAPLHQHKPPTIDDVNQAIAFLASDESLFISGENICVDNGLHSAAVPI